MTDVKEAMKRTRGLERLCVNCVSCDELHVCSNPKTVRSVVTGLGKRRCSWQRADEDQCGLEGKWFEAYNKEASA